MRFGSVCILLVLLLLPISATTTKKPLTQDHGTGGAGDDFNLEDALDPSNDIDGKNKHKEGGDFSDSDLSDVLNDKTYKPDKGKGGRDSGDTSQNKHHDENRGPSAEVFTVAGIISAVGMALVGAVSSYISYQKKKFCFSIQQSLNTDLMAENPEAVVATEPNGQQTSGDTKC